MKQIILYMLTVSLLIFTTGCHRNVVYSNSKYEICQRDDQYIIIFSDEYTKEAVEAVYDSGWISAPKFKNVSEMVEAIKTGNMEDFDLAGIAYETHKYYYDQQPLFDIENPLDVTLPTDTWIEYVIWGGEDYDFRLDSDLIIKEESWHGWLSVPTETEFQESFNSGYYRDEFEGYPNSTTVLPTRDAKERNGKEIRTPLKKYLRYEIVCDTQTLYVLETYYVKHYEGSPDEDIPTSEHIPYHVEIWGMGEYGNFNACFQSLAERPSVEWLSSFGLVPLEG